MGDKHRKSGVSVSDMPVSALETFHIVLFHKKNANDKKQYDNPGNFNESHFRTPRVVKSDFIVYLFVFFVNVDQTAVFLV